MELRAFEGKLLSIELGQNLGSKLSSEENKLLGILMDI